MLLLQATLLLSRGDRCVPLVLRSRWMFAVWVKMSFCLLFLGDFHSALSRAYSPGHGAPLLPLCARETWQMYLDMIHSRVSETGPLSLSPCRAATAFWYQFFELFVRDKNTRSVILHTYVALPCFLVVQSTKHHVWQTVVYHDFIFRGRARRHSS